MDKRRLAASTLGGLLLAGVVLAAVPAAAEQHEDGQTTADLQLMTPFVGVTVRPGEEVKLDLELFAPVGERVELHLAELPEGWAAELKARGFLVDEVLVTESPLKNIDLEIDVPAETPEGAYRAVIEAAAARRRVQLPVELHVTPAAAGGVSLTTDFPTLKGPADDTFTFNLELKNDTPRDIQVGLEAIGPPGWLIDARPSGQSRASSLAVEAGDTERIRVEVDPSDIADAGVYPIQVRASGDGVEATADLLLEITGRFDLALETKDQRLNVDVEAGKPTELPLLVINTGSAQLNEVKLRATPPRGWEVTFSPEEIPILAPDESVEVVATIVPDEQAINGDYRMSLRAFVDEADDSIDVRATVKTSAVWGIVGVGVILAALIVLTLAFRRYGRR